MRQAALGIIVGGGPAPGINGVIGAAAIEAINNGLKVVGFYDGFSHLAGEEFDPAADVVELAINDMSRIHFDGGSILRTARTNLLDKVKLEESFIAVPDRTLTSRVLQRLQALGITHLLTIGGDDTVLSARFVSEESGGRMRVVHVPKTIDNDLPLPADIPTFGFETARELGTRIVMNLMEDALTGQRWFLVVTMGRNAGHLALGIGKSSGATVTLIPEEWAGRDVRLQEVTDILATAVIRRMAEGKHYGVAIVAEGIIEHMSHEDLDMLDDAERDEHGHIRLSEVNSSDILKKALRKQLRDLGIDVRLISKDVGYELRCADPIAFDIDYTRSLGEAAVTFLVEGGTNATISIQQNQMVPIPFDQMMDPETGRTEVRQVDVDSFTYRSAYKFMIRLKPKHAGNEMLLARMAAQTNISLTEFKARFGYLVGIAPRPF